MKFDIWYIIYSINLLTGLVRSGTHGFEFDFNHSGWWPCLFCRWMCSMLLDTHWIPFHQVQVAIWNSPLLTCPASSASLVFKTASRGVFGWCIRRHGTTIERAVSNQNGGVGHEHVSTCHIEMSQMIWSKWRALFFSISQLRGFLLCQAAMKFKADLESDMQTQLLPWLESMEKDLDTWTIQMRKERWSDLKGGGP